MTVTRGSPHTVVGRCCRSSRLLQTHLHVPVVAFWRSNAGAYRQPYGSDTINFFGSGASSPASLRPTLVLNVTGPGPTVPVPTPQPPVSTTAGTVLSSTSPTLAFTCDGGTQHACHHQLRWRQGFLMDVEGAGRVDVCVGVVGWMCGRERWLACSRVVPLYMQRHTL